VLTIRAFWKLSLCRSFSETAEICSTALIVSSSAGVLVPLKGVEDPDELFVPCPFLLRICKLLGHNCERDQRLTQV